MRPDLMTSYYANLRKVRKERDLTPISISLKTPQWSQVDLQYQRLAPKRWMLQATKERYTKAYNEQLAKLNPNTVRSQLRILAGEGFTPVMLCYEAQPFSESNWCHRRMVAEWLEEALGIVIPEFIEKQNPQLF